MPGEEARVPALVVRGLTVVYGEAATAIDSIDLDLHAGEVVGLAGASGSGKSTLAHALLGLARVPGRIVAGSVSIGGRDLLGLREDERRAMRGKEIALIVQNPRAALDPIETVGRQIGEVWRAHASRAQPRDAQRRSRFDGDAGGRARALELLRMVGINDAERRIEAYAHELSGGMAQRVLIAMALSASPRVLVADEPTSGLDVTVQAQFLDRMWQAARDSGIAMLIVTQEPGILANYCDRVVTLSRGRIAADTQPACPAAPGAAEARTRSPEVHEPASAAPRLARVLLSAQALRKSFPVRGSDRRLHAVNDVSFDVLEGEALGLVGESGSGKTTVGRCLLGLMRPTSGDVRHGSVSVATLGRRALRELRREIQFVQQDPFDAFDPRWTLAESLAEPLALHEDRQGARTDERVRELVRSVGCDAGVLAAYPRELNASVLQRLNLARSLATRPRFIVLDEPTSMLAPEARVALVDLLRELQARTGVAYLFISHDLTTVAALCGRVAVMYLGQIVEVAPTREIFERPRHPYTRALIAAHLDPHPAVRRVDREPVERLSGEIPSPIDLPPGCFMASRCALALERCRIEPQQLAPLSASHEVRCWRAFEDKR